MIRNRKQRNKSVQYISATLFMQYVCGNWAEDHPRPDAYRSYDWFRDKQTKVYTIVRDFLAKNVTSHHRPVQQAKIMYDACMDTG